MVRNNTDIAEQYKNEKDEVEEISDWVIKLPDLFSHAPASLSDEQISAFLQFIS